MAEKYRNKYRIKSHRMPGWDYSNNGMYFITFVTQNRECNLGKIVNTHNSPANTHGRVSVILSDFGKIIKTEWLKSFEIRTELFCDEYIIMPNHIHAILIIDNGTNGTNETHGTNVETHGRASLSPSAAVQPPQSATNSQKSFVRLPKSISSFIGGYKSAINTKIDDYIDEHQLDIPKYNRNNHFFQPNYYDRIIRNKTEYHKIKNYIINNPSKWNDDKFNNPDPDN